MHRCTRSTTLLEWFEKLIYLKMFFNLYVKNIQCPRGEIGRHKGLELKNLSASEETLKVELRKFGGGLTANTEPSQKKFWKVQRLDTQHRIGEGIVQTANTL